MSDFDSQFDDQLEGDNPLLTVLEPALKEAGVGAGQWRELLQRLLDYGVLCRDESRVELELYDRFVRLERWVDAYLHLIGLRLQHDKNFNFVRVLPPGAQVPGLEDESDLPFAGGMRVRLSQQEVALTLILRAEYDKALREGALDASGSALVPLEAVALNLQNLLNRQLPETAGERKKLLQNLKQLRLIDFHADASLDGDEMWLRIRPLIVSYISNEQLRSLTDGTKAQTPTQQQAEIDAELATAADDETAELDSGKIAAHSLFES